MDWERRQELDSLLFWSYNRYPKERPSFHKVEIDYKYASAIANGRKTFEIRKNDKDYKVGDCLIFRVKNIPPHRWCIEIVEKLEDNLYKITNVLNQSEGLEEGYIILAFKKRKRW